MLVAAALIAVYIVLGMLYESYVHPITILSTLPSAGIGALVALLLFGVDLSIIAHRGAALAHRHREEERDLAHRLRASTPSATRASRRRQSIRRACSLRFRPILMTTCAALFGALPLAFGTGLGIRVPEAARDRDRRGPAGVAAPDALHDAGRLPRAGSPDPRQPRARPEGVRPPRRRDSATVLGAPRRLGGSRQDARRQKRERAQRRRELQPFLLWAPLLLLASWRLSSQVPSPGSGAPVAFWRAADAMR